jgi:hypothetical protein
VRIHLLIQRQSSYDSELSRRRVACEVKALFDELLCFFGDLCSRISGSVVPLEVESFPTCGNRLEHWISA